MTYVSVVICYKVIKMLKPKMKKKSNDKLVNKVYFYWDINKLLATEPWKVKA